MDVESVKVAVPRVSFDFGRASSTTASSSSSNMTRASRARSMYGKRQQEKSMKQFEVEAVEARNTDLLPLSEQDMVFSIQFEKRKQTGLNFSKYFFLNSVTEWRRKYIHFAKLLHILARISESHKSGRSSTARPAEEADLIPIFSSSFSASMSPDAAAFLSLLSSELEKV
jgi:hypothetical protein